ncbi:unnamed protein product [Rangifer tarandus platyrhynchus]|uniref:Uncharacterized protein n=1 Tax=Rangifer tarandus platyrhynchus TaxID=3082113 RepID=A0AC59Y430_RANTA
MLRWGGRLAAPSCIRPSQPRTRLARPGLVDTRHPGSTRPYSGGRRSPQGALGIHPVSQAPPKCGDLPGQAGGVSRGVRAQPGSSHWEAKLEPNQMEVPPTAQEGTSHPALRPQAGCLGNTWIWEPGARLSVLTLAWPHIHLGLQIFI